MTAFKMSGTPAIDGFSIILFGCHQKSENDEKCDCVAENEKLHDLHFPKAFKHSNKNNLLSINKMFPSLN